MKLNFSGRVLYANGDPYPGVSVRIFDKDTAGKEDDDLTIAPGLSDDQGRFSLNYEPLRYLDYHTINLPSTSRGPFNRPDRLSGLHVPDLGDAYLPYLRFNYTFNGQGRDFTTGLGVFQDEYYLPENPSLDFLPSAHGFRFSNCFPGYFLPFSPPAFLRSDKVKAQYGLCGGMCSAAYDFLLTGQPIPDKADVPRQGTRFHRYLLHRQVDSMGALGQQVVKVAQWSSMPTATLVGTQARTALEFEAIRRKLDDRNLVILALIYEYAPSIKQLSRLIFNNHQVLAYAYTPGPGGFFSIRVYDPNFPGRDDVSLSCEPVQLGEVDGGDGLKPVMGLQTSQLLAGDLYREVRGFFSMPYEPVKPPRIK